jgi:hypothetical protein
MAALGPASGARAADSPEGTPVTDPATLASFGFAPGTVLYMAAGANEENPGPQNYGGADPIMVTYLGNQFQGRISSYSYDTPTGQGDVSFLGGDTFADAQLHLPSGAIWENTRFWVNDAIAADIGLFAFQTCLPVAGPGNPVPTGLGTGSSTGTTGNQSIVIAAPAGTVIDNNACSYWVRVRFGAAGHVLQKARVQYRLQVSPAPATASFPVDVPTTHPFFRFVEAMARSGLTGGCGPGTFCPDTPVTRGQLSVFLSVALGLHFPN